MQHPHLSNALFYLWIAGHYFHIKRWIFWWVQNLSSHRWFYILCYSFKFAFIYNKYYFYLISIKHREVSTPFRYNQFLVWGVRDPLTMQIPLKIDTNIGVGGLRMLGYQWVVVCLHLCDTPFKEIALGMKKYISNILRIILYF